MLDNEGKTKTNFMALKYFGSGSVEKLIVLIPLARHLLNIHIHRSIILSDICLSLVSYAERINRLEV